MATKGQFLRVASAGEGKKGGQKQRTPYYFFLMEKKQQWEKEGKWDNNRTKEQLNQAVLPLWDELKTRPPHFMEKYIEQHRQWKAARNTDLEHKFDTMGRSLADIQRERQREVDLFNDMNREIEETVALLGHPGVAEASFFVAHFNYLCKTDRSFYPPCEVAVVEFSLRKGVIRCWQEFTSPLDSVPVGYSYKCQQHARVTHNLTKGFEHYEADYRGIMRSLITFLGGAKNDQLPPLYVLPDHTEAAECIADFMVERSAARRPLRIFDLSKLMLELHNLPLDSSGPEAFPSTYLAKDLLEADIFSHHAGLGCEFHEALENPHHCAASICRRLVFDLCGSCCPVYGLALRQGRHLPPDQQSNQPEISVKLKWASVNHVKSDRINRFVPTPGGTTAGPQNFDPSVDIEHRNPEDTHFPGLKDQGTRGGRSFQAEGGRQGAGWGEGGFPGRDYRTREGF